MGRKILVVEDEVSIRELIEFNLKQEGYQVTSYGDGRKAWEAFEQDRPDLALLDIMVPGLDGMELCRRIRGVSRIPVIMVSARIEEFDKVLALELGADDYMTKPFSVRELLARIRAVLRRTEENFSVPGEKVLASGDLTLIPDRHQVLRDGQEVPLTLTEFRILELLMKAPGRVMSREILMEQVWGESFFGDTRTIDVHVRHLREKVEEDPANPRFILTVRGVGYKFREIR